MTETSLDKLQPWVAQRAQAWLEMAQAYVLPLAFPGCKTRVTETLRTLERQSELQADKKSAVTVGFHNFGRAFDFICLDEHGVLIGDGTHPIYRTLGLLGETLGLYWGGRFSDYDHLEDRSHGTVAELSARGAAGLDT